MRRIISTVIALGVLLYATPALAWVVVERGPVNIRSGPGTNYPVLLTAQTGERFEETGKTGDWFRLKLSDNREAYVYSPLVRQESVASPNTVAIPKSTINVRSGPGTGYSIVGKAQAGAILPVSAISGQWVRVSLPNAQGYVASWLCTLKTLQPEQFEAGDIAKKIIALTTVRVRRGASEDYDTLATLKPGAQAEYLGSADGWHRVRTASGIVGWVDGSDVKVVSVTPGQGVTYETGEGYWEMRISSRGSSKTTVNLRRSPSTSAPIIGRLSKGQAFTVTESRNGWHHIQAGNLQGWVAGWLVTVLPAQGPAVVRLEEREHTKVLTVSGNFPTGKIVEFDALNLGIVAAPGPGTRGSLEVYAGEVGTVQIGQAGVLLTFLEKPYYRVTANKPGLVTIELGSCIGGISYSQGPKTRVNVEMLGHPEIRVTFNSQQGLLSLLFPGASLKAPVSLGPSGPVSNVSTEYVNGDTVLKFKLAPGSHYNLRRNQNLLCVDLLPKGLAGKTITIDPGHGGKDPGAIGPSKSIYEKQPNLEVALRLKRLLEGRGARVVMTRMSDSEGPSLAERVKVSLDSQSDVFISIHNNGSTNRSKRGTTVYYSETSVNSEQSLALGRAIQSSLIASLGTQDNGVKPAELYVCRNAPVAAVVAEIVYITNPEEEAKLKDPAFLEAAAQALLTGLVQYFGE